jgi:DNA-binding Lrp family transcriptional regulator
MISINDNEHVQPAGVAARHDNWQETTSMSAIGRRTMEPIANYMLLKAATHVDATAAIRLLLVQLVGYLGPDDVGSPSSRFVVFPGNARLADELRCSVRSIQRQADELEAMGLIRRCYNGMNRRTGFDLAPFAMRHRQIAAEICAIHTERRSRIEEAQLELGLTSERIERPGATRASSQGDAHVTLNRTEGSLVRTAGAALALLHGIDLDLLPDVQPGTFGGMDRTEDEALAACAHVTGLLSRDGRVVSLSWASAVNAMGGRAASGLFALASADPARRASVERYFSWLLKMTLAGKDDPVLQAKARIDRRAVAAAAKSQAATEKVLAAPVESETPGEVAVETVPAAETEREADAVAREDAVAVLCGGGSADGRLDLGDAEAAVRRKVGPKIFEAWLSKAEFVLDDGDLVVKAKGEFATRWIEGHLAGQMQRAIDEVSPGTTVKVKAA